MINVPPFDTDAMRQIADYHPLHSHEGLIVAPFVWNTIVCDHLAAADHIELLTAALDEARMTAGRAA